MDFDENWEATLDEVCQLQIMRGPCYRVAVDSEKIPFLEAVYMYNMFPLDQAIKNSTSITSGNAKLMALKQHWELRQDQFEFELLLLYEEFGYTSYFDIDRQEKVLLIGASWYNN